MAEYAFQDLTNDPLLQALPRVTVKDHLQPSIANVPLLAKIGEGSCGAVYRAFAIRLDREVAIKIMPTPSLSKRSQQLLNDIKAATAIKSPYLVEILDAGVESELFFQINEYMPGMSAQEHLYRLKERLAPGMKEAQALDTCTAAATGLAAAHQQNMLHLDIRPTSLFIPFDSLNKDLDFARTRLNDLGLAYNAGSAQILAGSECQTGTPGYLSPEQAQESGKLSPATDVFSFGATLYTLLVGQPPFGGLSLPIILAATVNQEVIDLRTWRPDISRVTSKVIEICLRKDPTQRFVNGDILLQALKIARAVLNDTLNAQLTAIQQIEALTSANMDKTALTSTTSTESVLPLADKLAKSSTRVHAATARPVPISSAPTMPLAPEVEWQDHSPVLQKETPPSAPRSKARRLLMVALLLTVCGAAAWQLGYLDQFIAKTRITAITLPQKRVTDFVDSPNTNLTSEKLAAAATVAQTQADTEANATEADKVKAITDAKAKAEEEAKAKEAERVAAEIKAKTAAAATSQAKATEATRVKAVERLATEVKAKADADAKATEAARVMAVERLATEVKAKTDADAKANETAKLKAIADMKTKAEEETRAKEADRKKNLQKEVTISLGGNVTMDFVLVPAGSFLMGTDRATLTELARVNNANEKDFMDESPTHQVRMDAFYITRTPVTVAQFKRFVTVMQYQTTAEKRGEAIILRDRKWQRVSGASWLQPGFEQNDDHPVVMLSCRDCEAFAAWAAQQSGKALRLPTETHWEYAARGPQNFIYPWGDKWDHKLVNHSDKTLKPFCVENWNYSNDDDGYAFTSPVGKYHNQSWCGALDMSGNVFQWCANNYEQYPQSGTAPVILMDPASISRNAKRALRGGSYLFRAIDCRATARRALSPQAWSGDLGMRLIF
ncbi:MAG: SUMF1/EgtB/PvdO family nonheme iron enzyme [Planctomycetota bacterium]